MAPIAKDSEVQMPGTVGTGAVAPRRDESAARTQPVALEVPVTVNGARTLEGSDKREPFSETTKTVLIFASGAVIRLTSTVAAGQLLFLTNENTKKEVVCQVVKSRNYSSVSGYVELEFTEPATGFWGMRFPAERTAPVPQASGVSPAKTANVPLVPRNVSPIPPAITNMPKTETLKTTPATVPLPAAPLPKPVSVPPAQPAARIETQPQASSAANSDTDALKQEAARLQEQLSGLLFAENSNLAAPTPQARGERPAAQETKAKVIEMAPKSDAAPASGSTPSSFAAPSLQNVTQKPRPDLTAGEVKIPAWLEPLARNASISVPEELEEVAVETVEAAPAAEEASAPNLEDAREFSNEGGFSSEASAPAFGSQTLFGEHSGEFDAGERRSGKGVLIGLLAAGIIAAAAGGAWYFKWWQPANGQAPTNPPVFATLPATDRTSAANTQAAQEAAKPEFAAEDPAPRTSSSSNAAQPLRTASAGNPPPVVNAREKERLESNRAAESHAAAASKPVQEPKKPALGDVKLAAPMVNAKGVNPEDPAAPHLGAGAPGGESMNTELIGGNAGEPAAPVPVGGDVKSARLLHAVPPVYPPIAKSQRISGDVRMDALVDETGHVTTMRIVSGPVLLHQAAMDAVRRWRYQPAMLDGRPVPMHLTVTVQFRLQ